MPPAPSRATIARGVRPLAPASRPYNSRTRGCRAAARRPSNRSGGADETRSAGDGADRCAFSGSRRHDRRALRHARARLSTRAGASGRWDGRSPIRPPSPGVVHLDLLENKLIGDPFYRDYEKGLQWIGKTDWEYRVAFDAAPEVFGRRHVELVFDGLDTYARVTLNGREILAADNMYRQWRVPLARTLLKARGNQLVVVFRSPINEDLAEGPARGYELPAVNDVGEKTSVYARKAPYSFGWDWGPRFVTCGIWKPVRLEAWDDARIADVAVRQTELGHGEGAPRGRGRDRGGTAGGVRAATAASRSPSKARRRSSRSSRSRTARRASASPSRSTRRACGGRTATASSPSTR